MEFREAARGRLIPFCQYLWPDFDPRPHRQLIAGALELLEARTIRNLMIFCPPQYGKSEVFSRFFPSWYLGRHPDDPMILVSYGDELAYNLSADARQKILEPDYQKLFGHLSARGKPLLVSRVRKSQKEWRLEGWRGRLKAAGMRTGITGHPAKVLLVDDPVKNWDEADSEILQEQNIQFFKTSALTRVHPNEGIVGFAGTRWHVNDLPGWALRHQRDGGRLYYVLRLTARAETPDQIKKWCDDNYVTPDRLLTSDRIVDLYQETGA